MSVSILSEPYPHMFKEREPPRADSSVSDLEFIDYLDYDDEEDPPLESDWHVAAMALLVGILRDFWTGHNDIYVSGNTVVRFDPAKRRKFRGPDLYVVKRVRNKDFRRSWVRWKEGNLTPDFVLELASRSSAQFDVRGKKKIYEKDLKTPEYTVYNPDTGVLKGWRLTNNRYRAIKPNKEGRLWCDELGLWLGLSEYRFFEDREPIKAPRFFKKDGQLVLSRDEAAKRQVETEAQRADIAERRLEAKAQQAKAETQRADIAERRLEAKAQQAKAEAQRADIAERRLEAKTQQAKAEKQRADMATQQAKRLAARLRELENKS
ncbi:MAG: hypothetical protein GY862_29595 [Gammaproteobacteria bacterium]|nr:hypothetical protein [Gammaproteobacteria bacterium]